MSQALLALAWSAVVLAPAVVALVYGWAVRLLSQFRHTTVFNYRQTEMFRRACAEHDRIESGKAERRQVLHLVPPLPPEVEDDGEPEGAA